MFSKFFDWKWIQNKNKKKINEKEFYFGWKFDLNKMWSTKNHQNKINNLIAATLFNHSENSVKITILSF